MMRIVDKVENTLDELLSELCTATHHEFNIFSSKESSVALREKIEDLFRLASKVAILVQIGDNEQHHAYQFSSSFDIYKTTVLGADFVEVCAESFDRQMKSLHTNSPEDFKSVTLTNIERKALAKTLLGNISDLCTPNQSLSSSTSEGYIDVTTSIRALTEVFGTPRLMAYHNDGYSVLELCLNPSEAELISYTQ